MLVHRRGAIVSRGLEVRLSAFPSWAHDAFRPILQWVMRVMHIASVSPTAHVEPSPDISGAWPQQHLNRMKIQVPGDDAPLVSLEGEHGPRKPSLSWHTGDGACHISIRPDRRT